METRELISKCTNGQVSARPGYYAGRGPNAGDINSTHLNQIADAIMQNFGEHAHDNYVQMVWEMKSLSATAFLDRLYLLEAHGWELSNIQGISENGNAFEKHEEAFFVVMENLARRNDPKDDNERPCHTTEMIRRNFRKLKTA